MRSASPNDSYTPREIALAAGVAEAQVLAALRARVCSGGRVSSIATETRPPSRYIPHDEAVQLGRMLASAASARPPAAAPAPNPPRMFSLFCDVTASRRTAGVPLALSSTLHAGLVAVAFFVATFNLSPRASALRIDERPPDAMPLVFLTTPGPGGGGGGGGLREPAPPPKAMREGHQPISSPLPKRVEPKPIIPLSEPTPAPLESEPVVAPVIAAPADTRTRAGLLLQTPVEHDSPGPGTGGGVGAGAGTGLGSGDGNGVGPGSGGGIGGGPYRAGSGIEPPRLVREVKADYTEDARKRGVAGDVVLEIVVRRDGTVGDVKMLQGLGGGLNERAVQAVRQWRFAPAMRLGAPVDVIVEVAVEFKLR